MPRLRFEILPSVIGPDPLLLGLLARLKCRYIKGKAIPVQALRFPGGCGSQIFRKLARDGGKFVSPTHPGNIPGTHLF